MAKDNDVADDIISGSLKRSRSYHSDYGKLTYQQIKEQAAANPPDEKARQMKKLIEQAARLREKRQEEAVMTKRADFKRALSAVFRHWENGDYDAALVKVESLLESWPGNARLHVLWASLVQLQEEPQHSLADAKEALQFAATLDEDSPAADIELGQYLDNVEDNPKAAVKAYAQGVATARRRLIEGLIGQAKAYRQLQQWDTFNRCLEELLILTRFDSSRNGAEVIEGDVWIRLSTGHAYVYPAKGPYAEQIKELLCELEPDGN